jgi:hypothetical protein
LLLGRLIDGRQGRHHDEVSFFLGYDSFLLWPLVASPDKEPVLVPAQLFVDRGWYLEALKAGTGRALTENVVRAGHNLKSGAGVADPLVDFAHEQPFFKFVADDSTFM